MSEASNKTQSRTRFVAHIEREQVEQIKETLERNGVSASWAFRQFVPAFLKLIDTRRPRRKHTPAA